MQSLKLRSLLGEGFGSSVKKEWPVEEKKAALEAIGRFNEYGNHLRRQHNILEIAHTLNGIAESAARFTSDMTEGTFDNRTVQRNMQEIQKRSEEFGKLAQEAHLLQQRMEASYEDMGHGLSRYFDIKDLQEGAPAVSKLSIKK